MIYTIKPLEWDDGEGGDKRVSGVDGWEYHLLPVPFDLFIVTADRLEATVKRRLVPNAAEGLEWANRHHAKQLRAYLEEPVLTPDGGIE